MRTRWFEIGIFVVLVISIWVLWGGNITWAEPNQSPERQTVPTRVVPPSPQPSTSEEPVPPPPQPSTKEESEPSSTAAPTPTSTETPAPTYTPTNTRTSTSVSMSIGSLTPTQTPKPTNTRTPTSVSMPISFLTPVYTATPLPGPEALLQTPVPDLIKGTILFFSDGYRITTPLVMNADGQLLFALTGMDYYRLAAAREAYSPDRSRRTFFAADTNRVLQVWIEDLVYGTRQLVSHNTKKKAFDPVWSPDGTRIAYVSAESGADEIYVYSIADNISRRLTFANALFVYYQHPSWSPDSSQIIFKSNREVGHFQIWMMNADGSNLHILRPSPYNDTDPIWVK